MKTKDFARTLRRLRQERGLTQRDVGLLSSVTGVCVSQWEAGRKPANATEVLAAVEAVSLPEDSTDTRVRETWLRREVRLRASLRMLRETLENIVRCNEEKTVLAESLGITLGETDSIDTGGLRALIACVEDSIGRERR